MSVYFIRNSESGHIKIGTSEDPEGRLGQLQSAHSAALELIAVVSGDASHEAIIHEWLSDYRIRGEWFRPEADLLAAIEKHRLPAL